MRTPILFSHIDSEEKVIFTDNIDQQPQYFLSKGTAYLVKAKLHENVFPDVKGRRLAVERVDSFTWVIRDLNGPEIQKTRAGYGA